MGTRLLVLFALIFWGLLGTARAQDVRSLTQARRSNLGTVVTVRGVVANGPELGGVRYLTDGAAGLAAYSTSPAFTDLQPGDSVELQGTLKDYHGQLELSPVTATRRLAQQRPLPLKEVAFADLASVYNEAHEGRLLRITGVPSLTTTSGVAVRTLTGNANYLLGGQRGALLRVAAASTGPQGLVGAAAPAGSFSVLGVLGQYALGSSSGYQLLPRTFADLEVGGGRPVVADVPVAIETSAQTIKVRFLTQNPGDTRVDFGRTAALGMVITNGAVTTQHVITLAGLRPGTTYFVKVSSANAAGASSAPVVLMVTDSRRKSSVTGTRSGK